MGGLNRGAWTEVEDQILTTYIKNHGIGKWRELPIEAGLNRCGKSCRLRWLNYLRPDIKRGNISHDEEELIIRLHKLLGNKWSLIAGRLPGRTDNEIKNYWNTTLRKKLNPQSSQLYKKRTMKKNKEKKPHVIELLTVSRSQTSSTGTKILRCTRDFVKPLRHELLAPVNNQNENMDARTSMAPKPYERTSQDDTFFDNFMTGLDLREPYITYPYQPDYFQIESNEIQDVGTDYSHLLHERMIEDRRQNEGFEPYSFSTANSLASFLNVEDIWK